LWGTGPTKELKRGAKIILLGVFISADRKKKEKKIQKPKKKKKRKKKFARHPGGRRSKKGGPMERADRGCGGKDETKLFQEPNEEGKGGGEAEGKKSGEGVPSGEKR